MLKVKPSNSKRNKKKAEIVAVGTENHGCFYLQQLGYLKAGESLEVKRYSATKKQVTGVISAVIKGIAKDKGITREEAAEYIFGKKVDGTIVFPSDQETVLSGYEEELGELSKNEVPTLEIWNFVATLMIFGYEVPVEGKGMEWIPGRIAYPVELLQEVSVNDEKIKIEPPSFVLSKGTKINFNGVILTVSENHDAEVEEVSIEKSPNNISAESTGFLYDTVTKSYVLGSQYWSVKDTLSLPQELVQAIFEFYQSETLNLMEESEGTDEKKALTPLEEVKNMMSTEVAEQTTLTGTPSISKSRSTESETVDLVVG